MYVVGIFRAALNPVISDDSSNSSIILGVHSGLTRNELSCLRLSTLSTADSCHKRPNSIGKFRTEDQKSQKFTTITVNNTV